MGLEPRTLTFSGLQRIGRAEAPSLPERQRAIQPVPVTGGNAGAPFQAAANVAGQVSDQAAAIHAAEQRAALAAALSRSEMALDRQLTETALKFEADHQGFEAAGQQVRDGWLQTLPPELQRQAGLVADRHLALHRNRILAVEHGRAKEADKAELLGRSEIELEKAMAAARAGDGEALTMAMAAFEASRKSLFDAGMISAEGSVKLGRALVDGVERQQAMQGFDAARGQGLAAAEAYIKQFEAGGVSPEIAHPDQRARIAGEMHRGLAADRAKRREREAAAKKAWREQFGEHREAVKVAAEAVVKGRQFVGFEDLKTEMAALAADDPKRYGPLLQTLNDAERLAGVQQDFPALPPSQRHKLIEARSAEVTRDADNTEIDLMKDIHNGAVETVRKDPHEHAAAHLDPDYHSPALTLTDPVSFGAGLQQRAAATAKITAWNDGQPVAFLRPGEAEAMRDAFNAMSAGDQALYLQAVNNGAGGYAPVIYEALGKAGAPELAHIGGLTALGPQHHGVAETALMGLQTEGVPLPQDHKLLFAEMTGPALAAAPRSRGVVKSTADAIYKGQALRRGLSKDDADTDLYEEAVQLALGKAVLPDGSQTGGLTEINDVMVVVPAGMTAARLREIFGALRGPSAVLDLTVMSTGGAPPRDSAGNAFDPNKHSLYPITSGDGTYYLSSTYPETEGVTYLRGTGPGGRYEMDIRRAPAKLIDASQAGTLSGLTAAGRELAAFAGDIVPEVDWQAAWDNSNVSLRPLAELAEKDDLIGFAARTLRDSDIGLPDLDETVDAPGAVGAAARLLKAITDTGVMAPPPDQEVWPRPPVNTSRQRQIREGR